MNKLRKIFTNVFENILSHAPAQWGMRKKHRAAAIYVILGILCIALGYGMGFLSSQYQIAVESVWKKSIDMYYDPVDIVLKKETVTLVDIRSKEAFAEGHIRSAVHIPVEIQDREIANAAEIIAKVAQLNPDTMIVVYGENTYSSDPLFAAELFDDLKFSVRMLRVGWNEFSHFSSFWLPENLMNTVDLMEFMEGSRFEN